MASLKKYQFEEGAGFGIKASSNENFVVCLINRQTTYLQFNRECLPSQGCGHAKTHVFIENLILENL